MKSYRKKKLMRDYMLNSKINTIWLSKNLMQSYAFLLDIKASKIKLGIL